MRKRERENPCGICGHYHKYEEGEVCGICGHRMPVGVEKTLIQVSAFPSEILQGFLYLGSYDNASRSELLKTLGISRVLNTVPACQNLYKNSFTYHCLPDSPTLAFNDAVEFLEQCEKDKARVLVHCMSGKNRSPAVVMAYLMKSRRWTLDQSYQWVKEYRPSVDLNPAVLQQLQEYAQNLQVAVEASGVALPPVPVGGAAPFSFGFTNPTSVPPPFPAFNTPATASIFTRADIPPPNEFTFGAAVQTQNTPQNLVSSGTSSVNPNATDVSMDGS
ncbi:protein-tyrosine-phosphatase IBR5 [Cynara cardunculus var. scolymus]|uniref:Dual specificity phosphatase n=1 Tax=Cynara cardunculus var. scolymus TaxID=59895 RepID=A0A103XLT7_CYNCS|nr:protein-tyrosine-phosphatase IBR5 [Cynara cardunculus var. scolymus]KVH93171.1 Dual specificity phosphatase [Cynara cardunculus var. scolymus]